MKKDFFIISLILILALLVYRGSFFNFFAQDDFILINHFSQNSIFIDLKNALGKPQVTHWRPVHNLFFLAAGNIFGKNYIGYHAMIFAIHIGVSFLIYKIINFIHKKFWVGVLCAIIYALHPAHFISLFWISGAATTIGMFLFLLSFYFYLNKKGLLTLILWAASLLASEAMLVGIGIFLSYSFLFDGKVSRRFLKNIFLTSICFLALKFFLTPKDTYQIYKIEINKNVIVALKYYILRIAGFAEVSGDLIISLIWALWLLIPLFLILRMLAKKEFFREILFGASLIIFGLFPFIFIPEHLSAHYMNISIWGFSFIVAFALVRTSYVIRNVLMVVFIIVASVNVNLISKDTWVVTRANLARRYIRSIESSNLPSQSTIVFNDNYISTSKEAYITLGGGKAIDFWFKEKKYKTCFTFLDKCPDQDIKIIR